MFLPISDLHSTYANVPELVRRVSALNSRTAGLCVRTNQQCSNHSDTTLFHPNHTNTPVHTETEQYTYIQSPAPKDEFNSIRNMLSS